MISKEKMNFWLKHNRNVLFIGKHGVGKTEAVKEIFTENFGTNWKYFSTPTLDPWVDFVGVPKEAVDESGSKYLEFIKPKHFRNDQIEAIFLDEFNRSHPKVLDAVMELIQFKSINGVKFNNLKVVWAAINPSDDEEGYIVSELDPAQKDRFHVHVEVPYDVSPEWFKATYGRHGMTACNWWRNLDESVKNKVSPRRLSYAVNEFLIGGSLYDVLPKEVSASELFNQLSMGSSLEAMHDIYLQRDDDAAVAFLKNENHYHATIKTIIENPKTYLQFYIEHLPVEKVIILFKEGNQAFIRALQQIPYEKHQDAFDSMLQYSKTQLTMAQKNNLQRWRLKYLNPNQSNTAIVLDLLEDKTKNMKFFNDEKARSETFHKIKDMLESGELNDDEHAIKLVFAAAVEAQCRSDGDICSHIFTEIIELIKSLMEPLGISIGDLLKEKFEIYSRARSPQTFNEKIVDVLQYKFILPSMPAKKYSGKIPQL